MSIEQIEIVEDVDHNEVVVDVTDLTEQQRVQVGLDVRDSYPVESVEDYYQHDAGTFRIFHITPGVLAHDA